MSPIQIQPSADEPARLQALLSGAVQPLRTFLRVLALLQIDQGCLNGALNDKQRFAAMSAPTRQ